MTAQSGLNVRESPSLLGKVIDILPYGSEVETEEIEDSTWLKIPGGYVFGSFVSDKKPERGTYLGNWRITAYAETGNACANGNYPTVGFTIACNSLPFGTHVWIEGVGERVVEDRGPDWLGSEWCDLYLGDEGSCIAWGNQYHDVYLVE